MHGTVMSSIWQWRVREHRNGWKISNTYQKEMAKLLPKVMERRYKKATCIIFHIQGSKLATNWSHMRLDFWLCA